MPTIPQTQSFKIFGAGASIGDTSITLQSFKNLDGTNLTMAHFGGTKGYLTIEPSSGTQEEQVSFASITNNANGTVTLGTIKNVLDYTPFTETAGLAKTHGGNVEVIVSNTSGFYNDILLGATASQIANVPAGNIAATTVQAAINELDTEKVGLAGTQTITGAKTFTTAQRPKLSTDTDTSTVEDLVTYGQLARQAISGAANGSTSVKGIYQTPSDAQVLAGTPTGTTGAQLALTTANTGTSSGKIPVIQSNGKLLSSVVDTKFGGTGADGALSISSGVTNIDLGSAQVVVKNYSSISITGTAALTFTNPHANGTIIILKSQGNITITSSASAAIDATGMGAAGVTTRGGTSGRGGAGLYIECGGAWNFTGTIKNNGQDGTISTTRNGANAGGGAGSTLILYNTLTSNSGTSQTNNGSASARETATGGTLTNGTDGNIAYGFFNRVTGGQGGNTGTAGTSTIFNQTIYSQYSKSIYVIPGSSGGSGGLAGGPTYYDGAVGAGIATSIIAANTEFA